MNLHTRFSEIGVGIIFVVIIGGVVFWQKNPAPKQVPTASSQEEMPALPEGITSLQVAEHSSRESCWSSINGSVYDLTSWIPQHPGGEQAILRLCGTDGSATFNAKHGGAPKQVSILSGFKIGTLTP